MSFNTYREYVKAEISDPRVAVLTIFRDAIYDHRFHRLDILFVGITQLRWRVRDSLQPAGYT